MSNDQADKLKTVLEWYAQPDPSIVGYIQRSGVNLAYVSHSEITRILIQVDPLWEWTPCGWADGRPQIHVENGIATMWGILTIHGKSLIGVGSARADKADHEKELIGDFLRNAAMRFGICLNLWSKEATDDSRSPQVRVSTTTSVTPRQPSSVASPAVNRPVAKPAVAGEVKKASAGNPISEKQLGFLNKLIKENNIPNPPVYATSIIGRSVDALSKMNAQEASQVIDRLMNPQPANEEMFVVDTQGDEEEPF